MDAEQLAIPLAVHGPPRPRRGHGRLLGRRVPVLKSYLPLVKAWLEDGRTVGETREIFDNPSAQNSTSEGPMSLPEKSERHRRVRVAGS
jgi:hypothetical protein